MERISSTKTSKEKAFLLILLAIPCLLIRQTLDNDIWFLLNSGRYVLENGIPHVEPFTIHADLAFVMQQWLAAVIFWLLYSNFGSLGILLIIFISYGLLICLVYKLCMVISNENFLVSYAVTFIIIAILSIFMVSRPYIFSTLIIIVEVYILECYISNRNQKILFLLPILSLYQINLHAAMWPILFVILIPYIVDSFSFKLLFIKGQGYAKKVLFINIILMILMGFLNPYGIESMLYLFKSYGHLEISNMVLELQPVNITSNIGKWVFGIFLILILIYTLYKKGTSRFRFILLTLGMAFIVLTSVRGLLFFAFCGLFPLSYFLKDIKIKEKKAESTRRLLFVRIVLIMIICFGITVGFVSKSMHAGNDEPKETGAVDYLLESTTIDTTILYTGYNSGGYAEYMGFQTYIDARAEVFVIENNKKDDIMYEYFELQEGDIYYKDFLEKYNFTHLLVSDEDILYIYLQYDDGYENVYEDDFYRIYQKIDE